jgi:hypothetical protein
MSLHLGEENDIHSGDNRLESKGEGDETDQ